MSDKSSLLAVWHFVDSGTNGSKALRGAAPSGHTSEQVTVSDSKMLSAESHEPGKGVVAPVPANSNACSPPVPQSIAQLASIIKAAGSDPGDITTAIWAAHYRKPERSEDEITDLTMNIIGNHCMDFLPPEVWPGTLDQVLKFELNQVVEGSYWEDIQPNGIVKAVLAAGYRLDESIAVQEATDRDIAVDEMHVMYVNAPDTTSVQQYLEMLYDAGYRKGATNG
ncbi:hypothetical protein [Yersinia pseudotuberculosis]|uniref:hypothetical protein n=1 Tax=Yersinia pseudotuberculosis TaxID=633 RepID=UPI0004F6BC33|nr:hypothetical protein [Yersinia pseudotuberculosis]AIN14696.1 hypothetical protein DJ40_4112 [Yersinia pseudotuberculosis]MBO1561571.1 hypothetical protein [Yersinia pseudotuberculosis]